jgi:hypothetical protein
LVVQACGGGDDDEPSTEPGADAVSDTSDGGVTSDGGDTDTVGGTCPADSAPCSRDRDCLEASLTGYTCNDAGCCEEDTNLAPCNRPNAPCEDDSQTTDTYVCDPGIGVCLARCVDALTEDSEGTNCPPNTNSYCFPVNDPDPPMNETTGDTLDGICIPGDCASNFDASGAVDSSVCDGVPSLFETDFVCNGGNCSCLPFGNGASYCAPGGTKALGEDCGADENDLCEGGLSCFRGTCISPCLVGSADACSGDGGPICPDGEDCECLEVLDTSGANRPGVCGVECDEFSAGQCPSGSTCTPSWGRFGLNGWLCTPAEDTLAAIGEECDVEGGNFGSCVEGAICTAETEGGPGTCQALCEPRGVSTGELASCTGTGAGPTVVEATEYLGASDYLTAAAGDYMYEVRTAAGALVAPANVSIVAGETSTIVAAIDDDEELTLLALTDVAADTTLPGAGIRGLHAASGVGPVDVYLATAFTDLAYGAPDATTTAIGETAVTVVTADGTELVPSGSPFTLANEEYIAVARLVDSAPEIAVTQSAAPTAVADAYLRLFHGANGAGNVDITIECGPTNEGCDAPGSAVDDLAYGDLSTLESWLGLDAGEYTVTIFAAGTETVAFTADLTFAAGDFVTAVAFLDGTDVKVGLLNEDPTPAAGDATITLIHGISGVDAVDVLLESTTPVRDDLAFGGVLGSADSSYVGLPAGSYQLNIRGGEDAATVAPILTSGIFELETGAFWTAIASGSAGGADDAAPALNLFADEIPVTLGEGEGAFRFIHAAFSAPAVQITEMGVPELVCSPISISGLGFCSELCEPFPRRADGAYPGCDDEADSCFPFVQRDDRAVAPLGSCNADDGTVALGGSCDEPGTIGGGCADLAVCIGEDENSVTGECTAICENFSENTEDNCPAGTSCGGVQPLLGNLAFSICFEPPNSGSAGDRCDTAGGACAEDGTICLGVTQTETECVRVCRSGFRDDCGDGETCRTGAFPASVVPSYMGICL